MRRRGTAEDLAVGVASAVVLCVLMTVALHPDPVESIGYAMSAVAGLAFALRRVAPVACLLIVALAIAAYTVSDSPGGPIYVAVFLAAMNLAAQRPATRTWLPWTLWAATLLFASELVVGDFEWHFLPVVVLLVVLPKIVADRAHERQLRSAALEARVESAEQEALRRMAEERLRIAREVHDVVGHGLAAISLRAGVADHVRDRDPEEVAAALHSIREVSKRSLAELSSLLGALREGEPAERAPAPNLAQVPRLVGTLSEAGLAVELHGRTSGADVPEIVGAAGYRIVQEALTNVARHAGQGARARVRIESVNGHVEVEVIDDGRGAGCRVAAGGGLTGMRERVQALGGQLEAGDAEHGGFRVWATLPTGPS